MKFQDTSHFTTNWFQKTAQSPLYTQSDWELSHLVCSEYSLPIPSPSWDPRDLLAPSFRGLDSALATQGGEEPEAPTAPRGLYPTPPHAHVQSKPPSRVQLCVTPWTVAHQAPPSFRFSRQEQEWVAMPSSKGSSQPRDPTWVSSTAGRFFTVWAWPDNVSCWKYPFQLWQHWVVRDL